MQPVVIGDVIWEPSADVIARSRLKRFMDQHGIETFSEGDEPERCVVVLDHDVQNTSPSNLAKYAAIEAFAREQGIEFHGAGSGIGHQIVIERGFARPGTLCVAADSHANMYGAAGALAHGFGPRLAFGRQGDQQGRTL